MPDTAAPENPTVTIPANDAQLTNAAADSVVYVIQSSFNYRDQDNYPKCDEDLVADEGWFIDDASAAARCDQLNANNQAYYDTAMAARERAHEKTIREAERKNLEAAAIRAAGLDKDDTTVPPPFVPETFEKFFAQSNHTVYAPVQIQRSDHDGIARAREVTTALRKKTP